MGLPIIDITTMMVRNAIGEVTNAVGALRSSTLNNYWGFKWPYVVPIDWGKPATGAFGYKLGDYRGYEHTYSAFALDGAFDISAGQYFEEGMRFQIDTRMLRTYMIKDLYYHTYNIQVSATGSHIWQDLGNFNLYDDNVEVFDVDLENVTDLNPEGTLYVKIIHSDSRNVTNPKWDDSQSLTLPVGGEYLFNFVTPISTPVSIINLNDYSAVGYYNSFSQTTELIVTSRSIRSGGADDSTSYVTQFYMDGNNEFGSDQIVGASNTTNVVGQNNPSPYMTINKTLQTAHWPIGRDGYADLWLINGSGNNSPSIVRVNFTILPDPPT